MVAITVLSYFIMHNENLYFTRMLISTVTKHLFCEQKVYISYALSSQHCRHARGHWSGSSQLVEV